MSISMSYINGNSSFPSINPRLKHTHKLKYNNHIRLRTTEHTGLLLQHGKRDTASLRIRAVANSLILGATAPAKSGDITVFLLTGAGMFFLYWITNFVVPDRLSEYAQFDEANEEQKPDDKR